MSGRAIIGRFGPGDNETVVVPDTFDSVDLDLVIGSRRLGFKISEAIENLNQLGLFPSEAAIDLLVLAALIYAADTRISREANSQDSWSRELFVCAPVSDVAMWNGVAPLLERTLRFLTGDFWRLRFRDRPPGFGPYAVQRPLVMTPPAFDGVCLFSGGMDSLIGAIDLLTDGRHPLLVSHSGDSSAPPAQDGCFNVLKELYEHVERLRVWIAVDKAALGGRGEVESTTRGRSFLFFALAAFAASGFASATTIYVPENGLISLNVPLDRLRLGSHSTRTTHPFYMARWDELLRNLGIVAHLENPYRYQTKGEMAAACRDQALLTRLLPVTMSCSSPSKARYQGHAPEHCGFCVPCIIRRAAIRTANLTDPGPYTLTDLSARTLRSTQAEGEQVRAFQIAAGRVAATPALADCLIHKPGPLNDDAEHLRELADVYRRGLGEVGQFLNNVETAPS